jgi:hypothetical protein
MGFLPILLFNPVPSLGWNGVFSCHKERTKDGTEQWD